MYWSHLWVSELRQEPKFFFYLLLCDSGLEMLVALNNNALVLMIL